jgi:hypothetical protein
MFFALMKKRQSFCYPTELVSHHPYQQPMDTIKVQ